MDKKYSHLYQAINQQIADPIVRLFSWRATTPNHVTHNQKMDMQRPKKKTKRQKRDSNSRSRRKWLDIQKNSRPSR